MLTKQSRDVTINEKSQCTHSIYVLSVFQLFKISKNKKGVWGNIIGVFECRIHIEKPVSMISRKAYICKAICHADMQAHRNITCTDTQLCSCIFFGDFLGYSSVGLARGTLQPTVAGLVPAPVAKSMGLVQVLQ
jgi:hypothetical protein